MGKYRYFETLEAISLLAEQAVVLACTDTPPTDRKRLSLLRPECDRLVCELEDSLFSDFLPPLERDSIAASAHCLSRIIDEALELSAHPLPPTANEEGAVCVRLAAKLSETVQILRRINKPDELPEIQGFRKLLSEGRKANRRMLDHLRSSALPRNAASAIIQTGRLRAELSRAFDETVEVMLCNI
jgi:hypothetical protein